MYFSSSKRYYSIVLSILSVVCFSQNKTDSIYQMKEVIIKKQAQERTARSTTPMQILTSDAIERLNVLQLSDAVKYFSGVTIKDYGGIGGLKTISVRSLGANHTAVSYDGITISDAQTGQIDLGKFSLDNVESISLHAGQSDNIFQTARLFASAGVLNVQTLSPQFEENEKYTIRTTLKGGSFGLINPRFLIENRITKKVSTSVNAEYMYSNGRYPYTTHFGNTGDLTSKGKRTNSDVEVFRAETGLFYNISEHSEFRAKAYYYQSERGLPGADIWYNESEPIQRLWDKTFFVQAHYENDLNEKWSVQSNSKLNWTYQRYLDSGYRGAGGKEENNYYQWEYYLSGTLLYRPVKNLSLSIASDAFINTMNADLKTFAYPTRYSFLNVFAAKYTTERFSILGNVLSTIVEEQVNYDKNVGDNQSTNYGKSGENQNRLSPSLSFSYKLFPKEDLRLRLMYKSIFRVPTFNDLYYSEVGNPDLKPEFTKQYNAGITWVKNIGIYIPFVSISIDSYYNNVEDKIVARPSANIFKWSIVNVGKVDIYGTDITFDAQIKPSDKYSITLSGTYTLQKAWDVTSKTDEVEKLQYKHQIAYTPEHSGSGRISFDNPFVTVSYAVVYSGDRYKLGENIPENYVGKYSDHSISFSKKLRWDKADISSSVEILNLFDSQYEIVKSYPMPRRSIRCTLLFKI